MIDADMLQFGELIDATMPIYRMETSKATKRLWWNVLKAYDFADVANAFGQHLRDNGKGITPADICQLIERAKPDGRPGAEEAWAMKPRDESETVVMTSEMAEAFGIASGLDPIAGRMAFREAYTRIVDRNRRAGIPPKWFASLGHDAHGREIAITEAVRMGRLTHDHAVGLLPPPEATAAPALLALVASNGILTSDSATPEERKTAKDRIESLKAMLTEPTQPLEGEL